MKFHEILKFTRTERGYKRKDFADKLNIRYSTYSNYENGARQPDFDTLIAFADFFEVPVDSLLGRAYKNLTSPGITLEQIQIMKHAIGFKPKLVKRGKFEAYRNHFAVADTNCDNWRDLCSKGLAIKRRDVLINSKIFHVSRKGLEYLEKMLEIKIVESD